MLKALIFDFDGTISDSFVPTVESYNSAASTLRTKVVTEEDYEIVRHNSIFNLVKLFKVSKWKIPFLAFLARRAFRNRVKDLEMFLGTNELFQILSKDFSLFIASSNSKSNLETFLNKNPDLKSTIKKIYGDRNPFNKHNMILKLLKEQNLQKDEVLYIGDEIRDIEACRKAEIQIISVSWGFSSRESLIAESEKDMVVDHPTELLKLIRKLSAKKA